jgi:hypothetical protein
LKNLKNYKFSGESCDEGLKKISTENLKRGEEKTFRVSVVEERKTFKFGRFSVFSRASLRTGPNDGREVDSKKEMRWEGVSDECWALDSIARLHFNRPKRPSQKGFFLTSLSGDFSQALIIDFSKKLENFAIFRGVSNLVFIVLWFFTLPRLIGLAYL